ncbi:hypothetical protein [Petroclostridium sp. X23]|uniref:hypothetical protein n=1 Tax=Petroclostridium sp. X23 TaxID=3045146 RepID=UPI0024ADF644|nr:hypothetical protein [Petroclostridium sp. X23]WHH60807.1 hypothetical protein QKW49_08950 [Petroclostridium sp. X23]
MAVKISGLLESLSDLNPTSARNCSHEVRTFRLLNNTLKDFYTDCIYIGKTSQLPSVPPSAPISFLLI